MRRETLIKECHLVSADAAFIAGQIAENKESAAELDEAAKQMERAARQLRLLAKGKSE